MAAFLAQIIREDFANHPTRTILKHSLVALAVPHGEAEVVAAAENGQGAAEIEQQADDVLQEDFSNLQENNLSFLAPSSNNNNDMEVEELKEEVKKSD